MVLTTCLVFLIILGFTFFFSYFFFLNKPLKRIVDTPSEDDIIDFLERKAQNLYLIPFSSFFVIMNDEMILYQSLTTI